MTTDRWGRSVLDLLRRGPNLELDSVDDRGDSVGAGSMPRLPRLAPNDSCRVGVSIGDLRGVPVDTKVVPAPVSFAEPALRLSVPDAALDPDMSAAVGSLRISTAVNPCVAASLTVIGSVTTSRPSGFRKVVAHFPSGWAPCWPKWRGSGVEYGAMVPWMTSVRTCTSPVLRLVILRAKGVPERERAWS